MQSNLTTIIIYAISHHFWLLSYKYNIFLLLNLHSYHICHDIEYMAEYLITKVKLLISVKF